ncbi:MAG: hypothetical protein DI536_28235 [Archangium gephyra]|uniref:Uncharacterized protein n=1 Tax=Archangium gephyra TaxID=48 RepID=A0A2W5SX31_9BACT|nr:MAG: hypothetical protein DI536_28235 [Archangium gephyra]
MSELTGLSAEEQVLAVRFAVETLRLDFSSVYSPRTSHVPMPDRTTPPTTGGGISHFDNGPRHASTDIKSFTNQKQPKSDQQFAAVVAYYFQFEARSEDRRETVNADIMKDAARLAGWPQVKRWAMTLHNAKNAGYLSGAGTGEFKLSSVGENLVAITLPGGSTVEKPTRSRPSPRSKKKAKAR